MVIARYTVFEIIVTTEWPCVKQDTNTGVLWNRFNKVASYKNKQFIKFTVKFTNYTIKILTHDYRFNKKTNNVYTDKIIT